DSAFCMLEVLKNGGFTNGGLNFDAKTRRASMTHEDIFLSYIAGMDTFALGLKVADKIMNDGRIDAFVKEKYSSFSTGIGAEIVNGNMDLEKLSEYALKCNVVEDKNSGKQEYLEGVVNSIMFGGF
ncbi:MAG: xylose isomerase, partial [Oscillospiraceae bacterium]